eukprot:9102914-Pyramimonas_sp.AAC.1
MRPANSNLGREKCVSKSDHEPAVLDLKSKVRASLGDAHQMICESRPMGGHKANGVVERSIQSIA